MAGSTGTGAGPATTRSGPAARPTARSTRCSARGSDRTPASPPTSRSSRRTSRSGPTTRASASLDGQGPGRAVDGRRETSWVSGAGAAPVDRDRSREAGDDRDAAPVRQPVAGRQDHPRVSGGPSRGTLERLHIVRRQDDLRRRAHLDAAGAADGDPLPSDRDDAQPVVGRLAGDRGARRGRDSRRLPRGEDDDLVARVERDLGALRRVDVHAVRLRGSPASARIR